MSSVMARKRSVSELEFWKNGAAIRAQVTRFLMNENNVPKRYTFVFTLPGIELAKKIMEEITAANTIRCETERDLLKRANHQVNAIIACEQLIQHLQWLKDTLPVKANNICEITDTLTREVTLIKAWRNSNKLIPSKKG